MKSKRELSEWNCLVRSVPLDGGGSQFVAESWRVNGLLLLPSNLRWQLALPFYVVFLLALAGTASRVENWAVQEAMGRGSWKARIGCKNAADASSPRYRCLSARNRISSSTASKIALGLTRQGRRALPERKMLRAWSVVSFFSFFRGWLFSFRYFLVCLECLLRLLWRNEERKYLVSFLFRRKVIFLIQSGDCSRKLHMRQKNEHWIRLQPRKIRAFNFVF